MRTELTGLPGWAAGLRFARPRDQPVGRRRLSPQRAGLGVRDEAGGSCLHRCLRAIQP